MGGERTDDERIIDLLAGPSVEDLGPAQRQRREDEINEGVDLLHRVYARRIWRYARRRHPYFSSLDMTDAWTRVLLNALTRARGGKFRRTGRLGGLLRKMMHCRCADLVRYRTRKRRSYEVFWDSVEEIAVQTEAREEQIDSIYRLLDEAIERLPPVQRTVWRAIRDCGFLVTNRRLAVFLRIRVPGREWTTAGVRRARQEGRKKIREYFREHDYDGRC